MTATNTHKSIIVQKYGGATLSTPEKIKQVAGRVAQLHKSGHQVVIVVSAMGTTTNELIMLAQTVSKKPARRELDMLLTTGERISMALVTMALHDLGIPAISFTGSQAGILTDDSHLNAQIIDVKPSRVEESLAQGKVVVLAGFQGVSPKTKEITTLGRGGTDTSAVAMAAALKAQRCEILKDVPAVLSADPQLIAQATIVNRVSYDQLVDMTFWGAKVLNYRSVELAREKKVFLYVGPAAHQTTEGTYVEEMGSFSDQGVLSVNSHKKVFKIQFPQVSEDEKNVKEQTQALALLESELESLDIAFPQMLLTKHSGSFAGWLTCSEEILQDIFKSKNILRQAQIADTELSSVSVTFKKPLGDKEIGNVKDILEKLKIKDFEFSTTQYTVSVIMSSHSRLSLIENLHQL